MTIADCSSTSTGSYATGAALRSFEATVVATACTFVRCCVTSHSSYAMGGGMYISVRSTALLTQCKFDACEATSSAFGTNIFFGGAALCVDGERLLAAWPLL